MATTIIPSQIMGITEILRDAFRILQRNGRIMFSIMLLLLFPLLLLLASHHIVVGPLMDNLEDEDHDDGPGNGRRGFMLFLGLESIFLLIFSAISLSAMALTMHASAVACTRRHTTLNEAVSRILIKWRRLAKTWVCVALITFAYALLYLILVATLGVVAAGNAWVSSIAVVGGLGGLLYVYMAVVWMLAFAVCTIEENCYGVVAIGRASKLIKGRRLDGFVLMLLLLLLAAPIPLVLYLNTIEEDPGTVARTAMGLTSTVVACVLKLFTYVVFTVFYYECRKFQGEILEVAEVSTGYNLMLNNM